MAKKISFMTKHGEKTFTARGLSKKAKSAAAKKRAAKACRRGGKDWRKKVAAGNFKAAQFVACK
jgi:hypothetical protein